MKKTLIIGYGNPDRQDDGVAYHILQKLAQQLNHPAVQDPEEYLVPGLANPDLWFMLQLVPEISEIIAQYERVCFVDAHTGAVPNDLNIEKLSACFQTSPLTHHLTASSCLCLSDTLYHHAPESILVSVRGYAFKFTHELSPATEELAAQAVEAILAWLQ
jgi:hydrogenase maturation protease